MDHNLFDANQNISQSLHHFKRRYRLWKQNEGTVISNSCESRTQALRLKGVACAGERNVLGRFERDGRWKIHENETERI